MRDTEDTIERLLAGLRQAEPYDGMPQRIHKAVQEAMAARGAVAAQSRWHKRILHPAFAVPLACVFVLTLAITVNQPRQARVGVRSSTARGPEAVTPGAPMVVGLAPLPVPRKRPHAPEVRARRETLIAGYPAPPFPLTEQEKLLLRLAHRGNAEEMALLVPEVQAAQSANATEQFQKFFAIDATEMRSEIE